MNGQNYRNHARNIPLWHFIVPLVLISVLIGSIINLVNSGEQNRYSAALLLVITVILMVIYWYARWFALRAQDRAIRAEENFRHYILTGQPIDPGLEIIQVIALRFASDEEMPALAKKALGENLTAKQIKQAIKNWRPDFNRV